MKALTNFEIDALFKKVASYGGCFLRNHLKLTDAKKSNKFYILNMDRDDLHDGKAHNGSHWVCLFNCNHKYVIYVDSFGLPPPENVVKFMKATGKIAVWSDIDLQWVNSDSCGWFASMVAKQLLKGKKLADILYNTFTMNPKENEKILQNYFRL